MSVTGKRGADTLNIIGIITVGICGAVLTYVSIILLEAFYMTETTAIERQKAFEAEASLRNTTRAQQVANLDGTREGTMSIATAIDQIAAEAAVDASRLVPGVERRFPEHKLNTPTVEAKYGRPVDLPPAPTPSKPVAPATEGPGGAPSGVEPAGGEPAGGAGTAPGDVAPPADPATTPQGGDAP
jgi:hypothetical protein